MFQVLEDSKAYQKAVENLVTLHEWPSEGWPLQWIQHFIKTLSFMDSNQCASSIGLGEREGRIFSSLVASRNYGFSHGIGKKSFKSLHCSSRHV